MSGILYVCQPHVKPLLVRSQCIAGAAGQVSLVGSQLQMQHVREFGVADVCREYTVELQFWCLDMYVS